MYLDTNILGGQVSYTFRLNIIWMLNLLLEENSYGFCQYSIRGFYFRTEEGMKG
jgi:hypothetical protein